MRFNVRVYQPVLLERYELDSSFVSANARLTRHLSLSGTNRDFLHSKQYCGRKS